MIASLPVGVNPAPLALPHFPDMLHAVVWRNWELVSSERLAAVLQATPEQIASLAEAMGLPPATAIPEEQRQELHRRSYVTLIRRNWHLLPYEQLLELLGWDAERLAFTLREDDFLWHKLGRLKPACPPVQYTPPSLSAQRHAAYIRKVVEEEFDGALGLPEEPPFAFLRQMVAPSRPVLCEVPASARIKIRFLYSYSALYGDPLTEPELDPYPDGYLAQLVALGVNGVWLPAVLYKLAPWSLAPTLSEGWERRLENLRQLVARAQKHGIGIYLYLNEPRALPVAFFERCPDLRGVVEEGLAALCTSTPTVQEFLRESLTTVFRAVPNLAGAFTITMSENLTNCHSHGRGQECPHCGPRGAAAVVAEVNRVIAEGVWRGQPQAHVIAWDWGWRNEWAAEVIAQLPREMWLMSVSEWDLPITRGGIESTVGEYSISAVGPGPRARRHWAAARRRGMRTAAKVQINNTWELSAVPYLLALQLVAEHMSNLTEEGIEGLMLSWTLGGYPSPNLEMAAQFYGELHPTVQQALWTVARRRFGEACAPLVIAAWEQFSAALREFPFHIDVVYQAPQQFGPANLCYREPTGYRATMTGFPYDDLEGWRGIYPPEVFQAQFAKVAAGWRAGLEKLQAACTMGASAAIADELRVAEAAYLHFQSVANQIAFVRARAEDWERCRELLRREIVVARRMFDLVNRDSRIGFEATNHYFYTRLDLVEKVVSCRYLLDEPTHL